MSTSSGRRGRGQGRTPKRFLKTLLAQAKALVQSGQIKLDKCLRDPLHCSSEYIQDAMDLLDFVTRNNGADMIQALVSLSQQRQKEAARPLWNEMRKRQEPRRKCASEYGAPAPPFTNNGAWGTPSEPGLPFSPPAQYRFQYNRFGGGVTAIAPAANPSSRTMEGQVCN